MNTIDLLFPQGGGVAELDRKFRKEWKSHVRLTLGGFYSINFRACLVMVAPMVWLSFDVLSSPGLTEVRLVRVLLTRITYVLDGMIWIRMLIYTCGFVSRRRELFLLDICISCIGAAAILLVG